MCVRERERERERGRKKTEKVEYSNSLKKNYFLCEKYQEQPGPDEITKLFRILDLDLVKQYACFFC